MNPEKVFWLLGMVVLIQVPLTYTVGCNYCNEGTPPNISYTCIEHRDWYHVTELGRFCQMCGHNTSWSGICQVQKGQSCCSPCPEGMINPKPYHMYTECQPDPQATPGQTDAPVMKNQSNKKTISIFVFVFAVATGFIPCII